MKRKNLISLLLALVMIVGCSLPGIVNAATDTNGNSKESVTTQEVTESGTEPVAVNATVASEFSVSVPKTIQLDGSKKSATYKVTCNGDFPANKKVSVIPAANVTLTSVNKTDIIASITQNKIEWLYNDNAEGTGTITADAITAGVWNGVFNFAIKFENAECAEGEHDWEYETKTEEKQELVKDAWDEETKAAYDEEVLESAVACNTCGKRFSATEYGNIEVAVEALMTHQADSFDSDKPCGGYHSDDRTITIHHDAEIVHHPAEYKTVTVETKVSRTCKKCQKHQERAEFQDETE